MTSPSTTGNEIKKNLGGYLIFIFEWISNIFAFLASILILGITFLVSYNALSRWLFGRSVPGTIELVEYGLLLITFIGAAWILRRDQHVKVDVLYMFIPDRVVIYIWYVGIGIATLMNLILTYYSYVEIYREFLSGQRLIGHFILSRWMISIFIPIGFTMLSLEFFIVLLRGPESRDVLGQDKLIDV